MIKLVVDQLAATSLSFASIYSNRVLATGMAGNPVVVQQVHAGPAECQLAECYRVIAMDIEVSVVPIQ
jgi:hypothetical protein